MQYSWYFDELIGGTEPCDTIEECLKEARRENDGTYEYVFIGTVEYYESKIDIDDLIEKIQDDVYYYTEDNIEDYLENVTDEEKGELSLMLNKAFDEWKNRYHYEVDYYFIKDAKAYEL